MASGLWLEPDTSRPLTRLKLLFVLVIGLNGIVARRMLSGWRWLAPGTTASTAPSRDLRGMLLSAAVSQVAWWGALLIGFYNSNR